MKIISLVSKETKIKIILIHSFHSLIDRDERLSLGWSEHVEEMGIFRHGWWFIKYVQYVWKEIWSNVKKALTIYILWPSSSLSRNGSWEIAMYIIGIIVCIGALSETMEFKMKKLLKLCPLVVWNAIQPLKMKRRNSMSCEMLMLCGWAEKVEGRKSDVCDLMHSRVCVHMQVCKPARIYMKERLT